MLRVIAIEILNFIFKVIGYCLPVKNRAVFLGSPRNERLMENGQIVYDNLTCDKKVIIKPLPHHLPDIIYVSYYILTSKVLIVDDHYRYFAYIPLKDNQKLIQMWHGPGAFKKVALDLPNYPIREEYTHRQYDVFITSSPSISKYIESGFHLSPDKIVPLGYPRSDLLINNQKQLKQEFDENFPEFKDKKMMVYLPTYRREGKNVLDYDYEMDWEVFDEYLSSNDTVCLVKRHPLQISNNLEIVPDFCKNVIDVGDFSYFPIIVASDLLITDYSSVFFDYLLLNKPIVFYCPDADDYLQNNGVYLNFPEDLPGDYCKSFDELLTVLERGHDDVDYTEFKIRYMESCDGKSTQRVVSLIEKYVNE